MQGFFIDHQLVQVHFITEILSGPASCHGCLNPRFQVALFQGLLREVRATVQACTDWFSLQLRGLTSVRLSNYRLFTKCFGVRCLGCGAGVGVGGGILHGASLGKGVGLLECYLPFQWRHDLLDEVASNCLTERARHTTNSDQETVFFFITLTPRVE